ncbi:SRPBCC family protein [Hoeflea prorocentri]|uniref:SRPBCC domain-containing protein n=1 Tax=Hoeflea prorocentri TaxID=1922333 RepID=A0A9X3UI61_9HYPH|nr:SRPBCC domain-containing protein [Hoeflea prorocentri]MCY6381114.1 SRPBCC domain-containing protein [Hoeflea prorocentri]MDA5398914.1 SRPBCC domain-containing protein [Hoeflea prorocentri]
MSNAEIIKTIFLAASRETVWDFLTRSEKLAEWFHPAERDLAEGEDYALMGQTDDGAPARLCWGTVVEMDKPSKMVWTFTIRPLDGAMTTVTWLLDDVADGTRLTLHHTGFTDIAAPFELMRALDSGWDKHLSDLRAADAL